MKSARTLKELLKRPEMDEVVVYIDNDIIFTASDDLIDFEMHPEDALIEALEVLGLNVEKV